MNPFVADGEQLAFLVAAENGPNIVLNAARAAVDLKRRPGYAEFTSGLVTIERADDDRVELLADNRWAASAIRTALLDAGYAIDADPGNESATVVAWLIKDEQASLQPPEIELTQRPNRERLGGEFLLEGPDGAVEQQFGTSGHNDLIVHSRHPFPGGARTECDEHGSHCWRRSSWPLGDRVRHLLSSAITENGEAWQIPAEAERRMWQLYLRYVHQSRSAPKEEQS